MLEWFFDGEYDFEIHFQLACYDQAENYDFQEKIARFENIVLTMAILDRNVRKYGTKINVLSFKKKVENFGEKIYIFNFYHIKKKLSKI